VNDEDVEGADEEEGDGVAEHKERREDGYDGRGFDTAVRVGGHVGYLEALGLVSQESWNIEDQ